MRLVLWPSYSRGAVVADTEIWRLISSGSKSVVVVPSSTRPLRLITPAQCSSASVSVVLPAPPWPTRATFRILAGGNDFTQHLASLAVPPPGRPASFRLARATGSLRGETVKGDHISSDE